MAREGRVGSSPRPDREGGADPGVPAPIRILHTSDLHLDGRFSGVIDPEIRTQRRWEHREVLRRIIDLAEEEDVHLLLFVGDLFDEATYGIETLLLMIDEFRRIHPRKVFIAPGLSDAYHRRSPYAALDWGDNVHIFRKNTFTSVFLPDFGARVYGIAPPGDRKEANLLRSFSPLKDDTVQIALHYGSNLDHIPEGAETPYPFKEKDAKATGVHYLALGGYPSFSKFGRRPVACYPGMPEGTGFDTPGEKVVVLAQVSRKRVSIRRHTVSARVFGEETVDLGGVGTVDGVVRAIEAALAGRDRPDAFIQVRLVGRPKPSLVLDPADLGQRVPVDHGLLQIVDETQTFPDWRAYSEEKTLAGELVRTMQKQANQDESGRRERVRDYGLVSLVGKRELRLRKPPSA